MRFADIRLGTTPAETDWLTPLAVAIGNNRPKTVKTLLDRGAQTNVENGKGTNLRTLADAHDDKEVLHLLMQHLPQG